MTNLEQPSKYRKCCTRTSIVLGSISFLTGLIMILAGFMRLTLLNNEYTQISCYVENKEVREIKGVCIGSTCSPSRFDGNVEFKLENSKEIWITVITSYTKLIVDDFMSDHFIIGAETQCYIDKNSNLIFQLYPTIPILVFSILFIIIGTLFFFGVIYSSCKFSMKRGYVDLDKDSVGL